MHHLFRKKRKLITIPTLAILSVMFWPFIMLASVVYFLNRRVKNSFLKYSLITLSILILIPVGFAWAYGFFVASPDQAPPVFTADKQNQKVAGVKDEKTIPQENKTIDTTKQEAQFVKVTDGDTIEVLLNDKTEKIRIIGINTPEIVDPRKAPECLGKEASDQAKKIFSNQKTVMLEKDPSQSERDKYNRLLRFVWLNNGTTDYGRLIISLGYAQEYTYDLPYKYQSLYKEEQKKAQELKVGLWKDDACESFQSNAPNSSTAALPNNFGPVGSGDLDCKDFSTQNEAQAYFDSKGGSTTNNIDNLDGADKDGRVCETLP